MAFYSYIFTANYARFFRKLRAVAKQENRSFLGLTLDTGWCVFRYGLALTDYLNFKIYNRTPDQRKEYVGARMENTFYEAVSPSQHKMRFAVKPTFMKEFQAYTKRAFVAPSEENRQEVLAFLEKHPVFISKPYNGLGGQDVTKVYRDSIGDWEQYYRDCVEKQVLLEELVIQHPQMNVLCPKSVNTIRIMTFNDHGKSEIIWMGLRVGNGVNDVDNFHAQGMGVRIDMETGRLVGNAVDKDNLEYTVHPTTGVQFDGFQIPCFQEAKELALRASLESDKILVVGWDVAISDKGPVIIEGNRRPGFDLPQVLDERGRMDMVRDVMARAAK